MVCMVRKYYNDFETDKSMELLKELSTAVDFVLIGGWAVNFYVKMQKSKDVDVVIPTEALAYFKAYGINKHGINAFYSTIRGITVDIFVQGFSDRELTIPTNRILVAYNTIENVKVIEKEMLMLLKLCGYFSNDKIKIEKDIIDVVSLLFYGEIDLNKVKRYIEEYNIEERKGRLGILEYLDKGISLWEYIVNTEAEYRQLSRKYKSEIKHLLY